jgi:hypothetical protein
MRLVHATNKTWYTVLYHTVLYVISLSNISIKTNFKMYVMGMYYVNDILDENGEISHNFI